MKQTLLASLTLLALLLPPAAFAQVNSGSNGSDGALNPTSNLVIDMADHPDGIYHYTSVNIPAGASRCPSFRMRGISRWFGWCRGIA